MNRVAVNIALAARSRRYEESTIMLVADGQAQYGAHGRAVALASRQMVRWSDATLADLPRFIADAALLAWTATTARERDHYAGCAYAYRRAWELIEAQRGAA